MSALIYFHSQGNMRGKIGRALVTKLLKWWAAGCPSPTSEDEQLCPAAVDEEACSAQDHKGISLLILYLACINRALGPVRALRMMPCFSTNITYICDDNCWYKRKLNNTFEEGILCNQFIEKTPNISQLCQCIGEFSSNKYFSCANTSLEVDQLTASTGSPWHSCNIILWGNSDRGSCIQWNCLLLRSEAEIIALSVLQHYRKDPYRVLLKQPHSENLMNSEDSVQEEDKSQGEEFKVSDCQ